MKTRTRTLAVIVATAASARLLTGLAMSAGSSAAPNTPRSTTFTMPMSITGVGSMMGGNATAAMHDAMHVAMHDGNAMTNGNTSAHAGHHMGSRP